MRFEREELILHPVDQVYPLARDGIEELLPHLPGIRSIEVLSRKTESPGKTRVRSRWTVHPPLLLRPLLPAQAFTWEEDALWIDKQRRVDSTIHGYGYGSKGTARYEPASDYTRIRVEVEATFDPRALQIPKENLEKILAGAEQALREAIEPNMAAFVEAIRERLGG